MRDEWRVFCATDDCEQFPVGYVTYAFGPQVFYFPLVRTMTEKPPNVLAGGVKVGRYVELDQDGRVRRSFGDGGRLGIANCCHYLLAFYGLNDDVPVFRANPWGYRMPSASATIASHDRPDRYNRLDRWLDLEFDATPAIDEIIGEAPASYNEDFWLLFSGAPDDKGARQLKLLSKRPLLNGRHVLALCHSLCTFATVALAEDPDPKRAHVVLRWMTLLAETPCVPFGPEHGCPPALDKVPDLLAALDKMLVAAQTHPQDVN